MFQIGHAVHACQEALGSITAPKITEHEHEVQHKVAEADKAEHQHQVEEEYRRIHPSKEESSKEEGAGGGGAMKETAATAAAEKPHEFADAVEPEAKPERTMEAAPEGEGGM